MVAHDCIVIYQMYRHKDSWTFIIRQFNAIKVVDGKNKAIHKLFVRNRPH